MSATGACPRCGALIFYPTVWHGITPPPAQYTCGCFAHERAPAYTSTSAVPITLDGCCEKTPCERTACPRKFVQDLDVQLAEAGIADYERALRSEDRHCPALPVELL